MNGRSIQASARSTGAVGGSNRVGGVWIERSNGGGGGGGCGTADEGPESTSRGGGQATDSYAGEAPGGACTPGACGGGCADGLIGAAISGTMPPSSGRPPD